jgi:polyhydroxybutyrate depolymerase
MLARVRLALAVVLVLAVLAGPAQASGEHTFHLASGRAYVAKAPPGHRPVAVLVLHALGHDWREPVQHGWSALADRERFVAVYPVSPDQTWNTGLCCGTAMHENRDDSRYVAEVVADVRARWHVSYVYLAGHSAGGMLVERVLAERPWLTGRAAVWAGAPEMPQPGRWTGRLWIGHGELDRTVPWQGGTVVLEGEPVTIRPAQQTPRYLPGARIHGQLYSGLGHAPPSWWPQAAWASFLAP